VNGFANRLVTVVNVLAAAVTVLIFLGMGAQVIARYVFASSLFWADDFAVWCLAWLVMLGSVSLAWEWRHVHVPMLVKAFPTRVRVPLIILSKAITLVFLVMMVWYGTQVFFGAFHRNAVSLGGISTRWFKLAIPLSMALMAVLVAIAVVRDLVDWRKGNVAAFDGYGREELPE
jgi:C4-dicarboxylate transporter DctQ subunit